MSAEWQHGLFSCFDNIGLSVIAFLFPCYQFGKNASVMGEGCFRCGLFYTIPILNIFAALKIRSRIRDMKRIQGSILSDILAIGFCPFCALIQEAQEMDAGPGSWAKSVMKITPNQCNQSMERMGAGPGNQSIDRMEMGASPVNQGPDGTDMDASPANQSMDKEMHEGPANQSMDKKEMGESPANQSMDKKEMGESPANQSMDKKEMDESPANQSMDKKEMEAGPGNQSMDRKL